MKTPPSIAFRTYVMKELACLYFPEERADLASRHFRLLIRQDPLLLSELQKLGFRPRQRMLPPSLVQVLLRHLGTPEQFDQISRQA